MGRTAGSGVESSVRKSEQKNFFAVPFFAQIL